MTTGGYNFTIQRQEMINNVSTYSPVLQVNGPSTAAFPQANTKLITNDFLVGPDAITGSLPTKYMRFTNEESAQTQSSILKIVGQKVVTGPVTEPGMQSVCAIQLSNPAADNNEGKWDMQLQVGTDFLQFMGDPQTAQGNWLINKQIFTLAGVEHGGAGIYPVAIADNVPWDASKNNRSFMVYNNLNLMGQIMPNNQAFNGSTVANDGVVSAMNLCVTDGQFVTQSTAGDIVIRTMPKTVITGPSNSVTVQNFHRPIHIGNVGNMATMSLDEHKVTIRNNVDVPQLNANSKITIQGADNNLNGLQFVVPNNGNTNLPLKFTLNARYVGPSAYSYLLGANTGVNAIYNSGLSLEREYNYNANDTVATQLDSINIANCSCSTVSNVVSMTNSSRRYTMVLQRVHNMVTISFALQADFVNDPPITVFPSSGLVPVLVIPDARYWPLHRVHSRNTPIRHTNWNNNAGVHVSSEWIVNTDGVVQIKTVTDDTQVLIQQDTDNYNVTITYIASMY
jgi:hypothetical protein